MCFRLIIYLFILIIWTLSLLNYINLTIHCIAINFENNSQCHVDGRQVLRCPDNRVPVGSPVPANAYTVSEPVILMKYLFETSQCRTLMQVWPSEGVIKSCILYFSAQSDLAKPPSAVCTNKCKVSWPIACGQLASSHSHWMTPPQQDMCISSVRTMLATIW